AAGVIATTIGAVLSALAFSCIRAIHDVGAPANGIQASAVPFFLSLPVAGALGGCCLGIAQGQFLKLVGVELRSWCLHALIGGFLGAILVDAQIGLLCLVEPNDVSDAPFVCA